MKIVVLVSASVLVRSQSEETDPPAPVAEQVDPGGSTAPDGTCEGDSCGQTIEEIQAAVKEGCEAGTIIECASLVGISRQIHPYNAFASKHVIMRCMSTSFAWLSVPEALP